VHAGSHSVAQPTALRQHSLTSSPLVLGTFLAIYGNLVSIALATVSPAGGWPGVVLGMLPAGVALLWARHNGLGRADLGLTTARAARSAAVGLLFAAGLAAVSVVFLRMPPTLVQPVAYNPLNSLPLEAVLWRAFFWMPLDTAIPEEISFRGALLGGLRRDFAVRRAVIISAVTFTLWHIVIVTRTLLATNLSAEPLLFALGLAGALGAIFVGGIVFAVLRLRTGNLAGSIVMHWAFNAILLVGIYTPTA
jgi:membrane protease YdiL (CAAX protease family)